MCTTQRGAVGYEQSERDLIQIVRIERTQLQRSNPRLGDLFAEILVVDPLQLGPQLFHRFTHCYAPYEVAVSEVK